MALNEIVRSWNLYLMSTSDSTLPSFFATYKAHVKIEKLKIVWPHVEHNEIVPAIFEY